MFLCQNYNKNKGISLVEVIVAVFVIVVALAAILNIAVVSLQLSYDSRSELQAQFFAQEALEAVRNFRDGVAWNSNDANNWYDGLGVVEKGVAYHPKLSADIPAKWQLLQGQETLGVFTRNVTFAIGQRDAQNNIVQAGGAADPDTVQVVATVSWIEKGAARQSALTMYLTNWSP